MLDRSTQQVWRAGERDVADLLQHYRTGETAGLCRGAAARRYHDRAFPLDCKCTSMTKTIRVLIADNHAMVREGLTAILALQPDMELVGEAGDGIEAVALPRALQPNVILLDLVMPRRGRNWPCWASTKATLAPEPPAG